MFGTLALRRSVSSKRQLPNLFALEFRHISNCLIPNFSVSLPTYAAAHVLHLLITFKHLLNIKLLFFPFMSYDKWRLSFMLTVGAGAVGAFFNVISCPEFPSLLRMLDASQGKRRLWVRECPLWSQSRTKSPRAFWSARELPERLWGIGCHFLRKRGVHVALLRI